MQVVICEIIVNCCRMKVVARLRRGRSMTRCEWKVALFSGAVARIGSAFIEAHRKGSPIYYSAARPRRRLCASYAGAFRALPYERKRSYLLCPTGHTLLRRAHRHSVPMKHIAPGGGSSPHPGVGVARCNGLLIYRHLPLFYQFSKCLGCGFMLYA